MIASRHRSTYLAALAALALPLAACGDNSDSGDDQPPKIDASVDAPPPQTPDANVDAPPAPTAKVNVIFFLGDGMGVAAQTAARIYSVGEDGELTMDTLPETAWVRTYSHDSMVTDSAPSMSAYMTGVKMDNNVLSMSSDTKTIPAVNGVSQCEKNGPNGHAVPTFLEQAVAARYATGVVTTTNITDATPAATYAHTCARSAMNDIAAMLTPGGAGYNAKLGDGVDVIFGGGRENFLPKSTASSRRQDERDLPAELKAKGYTYAADKAGFDAIDATTVKKAVGLFSLKDLAYEADRDPTKEPSLTEMATKAVDILGKSGKPYFLMVEGGRIDHAEHATNGRRVVIETVSFDNTIKAVLAKVRESDPELAHTLIVVTADHDHTMHLNGYAQRTGKTTPTSAGVLGLVKNVVTGAFEKDAGGRPYTIIGFGNGPNRVAGARSSVAELTEDVTSALGYNQEAAFKLSSETHGGTDVPIMAIGKGADQFHGFMTNTEVFGLLHNAAGF